MENENSQLRKMNTGGKINEIRIRKETFRASAHIQSVKEQILVLQCAFHQHRVPVWVKHKVSSHR